LSILRKTASLLGFVVFPVSDQSEQMIGSEPANQQPAISNGAVNINGAYDLLIFGSH